MSDLISREEVLKEKWTLEYPCSTSEEVVSVEDINSIPSADIMECARAIKEYCKSKPNSILECMKCPLYGKLCFTHDNIPIPCVWDLPESEDKE